MKLLQTLKNQIVSLQYSNRKRQSGIVALLFLAASNVLLLPTKSEASFGIMPMEVQLKMPSAGNRITNDIEVYNGSDEALHIKGTVSDWKLTPEGAYEYLAANTTPESCANWIQLNPIEFNLPPKQSMRVRYTITSPEALKEERRAMIFFQSRPLPVKGNSFGLAVSMRMGCKVFVVPAQPLAQAAQITDMDLVAAPRTTAKVSVQNKGNASFRMQGKVEVWSETDELLAKGELLPPKAQVLPGATRNLKLELDKPLPTGNYRLKAVVDYGAKELIGGELKAKIAPVLATGHLTPEPELPQLVPMAGSTPTGK